MTAMPETSLWSVPDPWKTHRTRFPPVLGRRTDRAAHNAPQAHLVMSVHDEKARKMTSQMEGAPGMR